MQSIRSSLPRRALQLSAVPRTLAAQRPLSSTSQLRSADSHGDHYNPPGGWLFGVKPGEKYQNEGWENVFYWGFFGSMAFGVIGYCYKPDTRYVARRSKSMWRHSADIFAAFRLGLLRRQEDGSKPRVFSQTPSRRYQKAKAYPREEYQSDQSYDTATMQPVCT